jgi:hypothetical protein
MAFFDLFVSEQEKKHRRMALLNKFSEAVEDYCDSEDNLEFFINPERKKANIWVYHSDSPRSFGIGGAKEGTTKPASIRYGNAINLSQLESSLKLKNEYKKLKSQNNSWEEIFESLSDSIVDLLVEAVTEFERKYSLPKQW